MMIFCKPLQYKNLSATSKRQKVFILLNRRLSLLSKIDMYSSSTWFNRFLMVLGYYLLIKSYILHYTSYNYIPTLSWYVYHHFMPWYIMLCVQTCSVPIYSLLKQIGQLNYLLYILHLMILFSKVV